MILNNMEEQNTLLEHAVINQIETDLNDNEYDSISDMLNKLFEIEEAKTILIEYLSDSAKENWLEGKTSIRY